MFQSKSRRGELAGAFLLGIILGVGLLFIGLELGRKTSPQVPSDQLLEIKGSQEEIDSASPEQLVQEQLKDGERALEIIDEAAARGQRGYANANLTYFYSRQILGAKLFLVVPEGKGRTTDPEVYLTNDHSATSETLEAFQTHLTRMKSWEARLVRLVASRQIPELEYLRSRLLRLEAENWLAREKNREISDAIEDPDDAGLTIH